MSITKIKVSDLAVEVVRKPIKNLHLGVYPPAGRVRVAVPLSIKNEAVRLAVIGKLGWIKRQRAKFEAQPRQSRREMVNGESHYYFGRRYRLRVVDSASGAKIVVRNASILELQVRPGTTAGQRERVLQDWYREQLKRKIPTILEKWQAVVGVEVAEWGIKKMKTKWGSCNARDGRIWLNLELAKKPVKCLEYIIVHELVHLLERRHNERFLELMNKFMLRWKTYKAELAQMPLGHDEWGY
jgi:predicted metal-dependent hydrolase